MLVITLNKAIYEYDIHAIVKAFYPERNVKVITPDTDPVKVNELLEAEEALQGSIAFLEEKVVFDLDENSYEWNWSDMFLDSEAYTPDYKDKFK